MGDPAFITWRPRRPGEKPQRYLNVTALAKEPEAVKQQWWAELKRCNPDGAELLRDHMPNLDAFVLSFPGTRVEIALPKVPA